MLTAKNFETRVFWAALISLGSVGGDAAAGALVDTAAEIGIAETTPAYHMTAADYDGDGWPDILVNRRWTLPFRLYRNVGGSFVEDTRIDFGIRDRLDCQWGDPNVDGRLDLYCGRGASHGTATKANQLWIQQPDGSFQDQAAAWNVTDPHGRSRSVVWLNFNGDGFPDLFVGNHFPRQDGIPSPNRLFVNQAGSRFSELVIPGFTEEIGGAPAFAVDMDADGLDDLLVCGASTLYAFRNTGGTGFVDMTTALGLRYYARSAIAADVDQDGQLDLVVTIPREVRIYPGQGPWSFGEPQRFAGQNLFDTVTADVDGDGDLDIYVSSTNPSGSANPADLLLRNGGSGVFTPEVVASSSQGSGGRVAVIDHDLDGRAGILLVNSRGVGDGGPLQFFQDSPPVQPSTNLIPNGDFETGRLTPWVSWRGALQIVRDETRGGSWVGTVRVRGGGGQVIAANANTRYTLRVSGRVDLSHWAAAGYQFQDASGKPIAAGRNLAPFGTSYAEQTVSFETPPNTTSILVQIWNMAGGSVYVDDFSLTAP